MVAELEAAAPFHIGVGMGLKQTAPLAFPPQSAMGV